MRRVRLIDEVACVRPDVDDPESAISSGRVRVDGAVITNPRSNVTRGCAIVVEQPAELRGAVKLRAALDAFGVAVDGRTCLDVGASTGGFTTVLLERGARHVYAVDAGHGQLLGSLRQDSRVTNLEATNVGDLTAELVAEPIGLVTVDVSYLSLRDAIGQLGRVELAATCELVGLVKPMFELALSVAPTDQTSLDEAVEIASRGAIDAGWEVIDRAPSAVTGAKGAIEGWVHGVYRG